MYLQKHIKKLHLKINKYYLNSQIKVKQKYTTSLLKTKIKTYETKNDSQPNLFHSFIPKLITNVNKEAY